MYKQRHTSIIQTSIKDVDELDNEHWKETGSKSGRQAKRLGKRVTQQFILSAVFTVSRADQIIGEKRFEGIFIGRV